MAVATLHLIELLAKSNSVNLDGVRAEEIKKSLSADANEELLHAQQVGQHIKQLGGLAPESAKVKLSDQIQPTSDTTDVAAVIKAAIDAEQKACAHYKEVVHATDAEDSVTQDLCVRLLAAEEEHLVLFQENLREYGSQ